jgi:hypothetical protein
MAHGKGRGWIWGTEDEIGDLNAMTNKIKGAAAGIAIRPAAFIEVVLRVGMK